MLRWLCNLGWHRLTGGGWSSTVSVDYPINERNRVTMTYTKCHRCHRYVRAGSLWRESA